MGRRKQVFVAPGDDDDRLPIPESPWHTGRWVHLPRENWELVLDFADSLESVGGALLRRISRAPSPSTQDAVALGSQELRILHTFLGDLERSVEAAAPLIGEPTAAVPDAYTNEEHARMIRAVWAVVGEALLSAQPFRAWIE